MPYNVACFTSTLASMFLGSVVALLVRRPEEIRRRAGLRREGLREPGAIAVVARKLRRAVLRAVRPAAAEALPADDAPVRISKLDGKLPLLLVLAAGGWVAAVGINTAEGEMRRMFRMLGG